jgi:hypothetical protein
MPIDLNTDEGYGVGLSEYGSLSGFAEDMTSEMIDPSIPYEMEGVGSPELLGYEAEEALFNSPKAAPALDGVGACDCRFEGLGGGLSGPSSDVLKVLAAAQMPGTKQAAKVAQQLLKQSVKIGTKTEERATAMAKARSEYRSLLRKIVNLDATTEQLMHKLFDEEGDLRPGATRAELLKLKDLRKQAFQLGREAVRWQKTNVVATALAKNGWSQAQLLQQMAMTLMTANPKTTAILATQFKAIGQDNEAIRALRKVQTTKWKANDLKPGGLQGLGELDEGPEYWEAELAGMEAVEMSFYNTLDELAFWKSIKKAARSVSRGVKRTARSASRAVKRTARSASRSVKSATRAARRAASRTAQSITRRAKKIGTAAYRRAANAAKKASRQFKKYARPVIKTARTMSKPVGRFIKATSRVAIAPYKAAYYAGGRVLKGDIKGATRYISRSVKDTAKNIAAASAAMTIGMQCAFEKTPLGKATAQAVGTAVGSFYGGPVGGAVGNEAGRRANQVSRGVCNGMDKIGLTRGTFRPSQVGKAIRGTAREIYKKTLQPKELLKSAVNIGMNYATGGAGGGVISAQGAQQLMNQARSFSTEQAAAYAKQQLRKQISPQNLQRLVKKHGKQYLQREMQRNIRRNPTLRKLSRSVPAVNAVYNMTGAFRNGRVDLNKLQKQVTAQGTAALQQEARRAVGRYAPRTAAQIARATLGRRRVAQIQRMRRQAQQASALYPSARRFVQDPRAGMLTAGRRALPQLRRLTA